MWCDDAGVTCRRWKWRQAPTQLTGESTAVPLILDALAPMTGQAVEAAAEDLPTP